MAKVPFSIKAAEKVTLGLGTWKFLGFQTLFLVTWAIVNIIGLVKLDPWPFIAMNLILSLQAAYTAPILLMAERRHAEHDREIAAKDLLTDKQAAKEISEIKQSVERMERAFLLMVEAARERKAKEKNHGS